MIGTCKNHVNVEYMGKCGSSSAIDPADVYHRRRHKYTYLHKQDDHGYKYPQKMSVIYIDSTPTPTSSTVYIRDLGVIRNFIEALGSSNIYLISEHPHQPKMLHRRQNLTYETQLRRKRSTHPQNSVSSLHTGVWPHSYGHTFNKTQSEILV